MKSLLKTRIGVIGLGYVGLPLAVEFGKILDTIGFDIKEDRIKKLKEGIDASGELSREDIKESELLTFSSNLQDLKECNFFIVAVPTPVNDFNHPDFTPLEKASETVGRIIKKGDVVVYESTVYPGATEEICVPLLERESGLKYNKDFFVGYSPERISPADKNNVYDIVKITSGSTPEISRYIDRVYRLIIKAGTFRVNSIKIAEACKVIENTQRDINIAYINEISIFLQKLGLNTHDVLDAMKTKWNALPFVPGLVGGHCIGVDPYYLISKAQELGCDLRLVKSARQINDSIPAHIAQQTISTMCKKAINPNNARVIIFGATFKENCPDIRNARPFDIAKELEKYEVKVDIYDPIADSADVQNAYNYKLISDPQKNTYDAIIIAVAHDVFINMGIEKIKSFGKNKCIVFDIKSIFDKKYSDLRL